MYLTLDTDVNRQVCLILGTIAPPEENLVSIAMLSHTLKKDGASRVIGVFPYMSYTRQDKAEAGKSFTFQWLGEFLRASGMDEVWTIDQYKEQARNDNYIKYASTISSKH